MTRGVAWYVVGSLVLVALVALAGCSHYLFAERESWRHEAEVACLNSGALKDAPGRVQISAIEGPGACGIDYPLRVSALGQSAALSYDDETLRPPGSIPPPHLPPRAAEGWEGAPQNWPAAQPYLQSAPLPPPPGASASQMYPPQASPAQVAPPAYPAPQPYPTAQAGQPLSLNPPGLPPHEDDDDIGIPGGPPHPYYGGPTAPIYAPNETPPLGAPVPPLGPQPPPFPPPHAGEGWEGVTAAAGPVDVQPPATLACPIVSALDQWIAAAVQPAAQHWFRQPVVGIKQISAYSCRGMNGNPNAHISEHAFGNALDIAEFDLADGHKISVQYGWHGTPQEQGFLHDVQAAACEEFTTVLAPGANVYHYNHIHVDLMRHYNGRRVCEPGAIPGEVAAARARSQFAQHDRGRYGDPGVTGSIEAHRTPRDDTGEDDDSVPDAVPGED